MAKAAAARTTREATRLPLAERLLSTEEKGEDAGFVFDHDNVDYLLVEDVIPGVRMNQRNIAYHKRIGFEVASKDEAVTGHSGYTLMSRPKAVGDKQRAAESARNNSGRKRGGEQASRRELTEGVIQVETNKGLKLKDMGGALPEEADVRRRERDIDERTREMMDDPRLNEAATQSLDDLA